MPLPVIVAAALPFVPLLLEAIALILSIVDAVQGDGGLMDRAQEHTFKLDAILAELDPAIAASLRAILDARTAVILADTQELTEVDVPAILAAISGIPPAPTGASFLNTGVFSDAGAAYAWTVRDILTGLGRPHLEGARGIGYLLTENPDFLMRLDFSSNALVPPSTIRNVNVRVRLAGETLGQTLIRQAPYGTWRLDQNGYWTNYGPWTLRTPPYSVIARGLGALVCLLPEADEATRGRGALTGEYDARLAGLKSDAEAIAAGTSDLLIDVAAVHVEVSAVNADTDALLARTLNTAAADDKILVTDFGAGGAVDLGDVATRLRQYLPLSGEGTIGAPAAISGTGTAALPAGSAYILIELADIPAGMSAYPDMAPYYQTLGTIIFGYSGRWGMVDALHRTTNWLHVPPGADAIMWALQPAVTGQLRVVAAAS